MIEVTVNRPNLVIETNLASATGPTGPAGPAGPAGASGATQNVNTVADHAAGSFDVNTKAARILGYYAIGRGEFNVRRVNSQPTHPWKFRSTDRYKADGTTDATNGGWWEGYTPDGIISPEMFGAKGDNSTDDLAAFNNAVTYASVFNTAGIGAANTTWIEIHLPSTGYYLSGTLSLASGQITIKGKLVEGFGNGPRLRFPVDVCGIHVGAGTFGCRLENFMLVGVNGNGSNAHGLWIEAKTTFKDISIQSFSNHGVYMFSGGGSNVDNSYAENIKIYQCGQDGWHIEGVDAQVCVFSNIWISACGGCAIYDVANYQNRWINVTIEGNGLLGYQTRTGVKGAVVLGSDAHHYMVHPGQDVAASTTDPAASSNDNVWVRLPDSFYIASAETWVSGHTYNTAPSILMGSGSVFDVVYTESGYSPPAWTPTGICFGTRLNNIDQVNDPSITFSSNWIRTYSGWSFEQNCSPRNAVQSTITMQMGGDPNNAHLLSFSDSASPQIGFVTYFDRTYHDMVWSTSYNYDVLRFTGLNSTYKAGNSTNAITESLVARRGLWIGNSALADNASRSISVVADTVPTTGEAVAGNLILNNGAAAGKAGLWVCTTGGVNAAQVWTPIIVAPVNNGYQSNSTAPTANNLNLTTTDITGGLIDSYLELTANLGANATCTLPSVASLVSALGEAFYPGFNYTLYLVNLSAGAFQWTMTTGTGWSNFGTMTVAQNTWRKFRIEFISASSAQILGYKITGPAA